MHISTWFVLKIYQSVARIQIRITMQMHNSSEARPPLYTQTASVFFISLPYLVIRILLGFTFISSVASFLDILSISSWRTMLVSPPPSPPSKQNEIHHAVSNAQLIIGQVSNAQLIIQSL